MHSKWQSLANSFPAVTRKLGGLIILLFKTTVYLGENNCKWIFYKHSTSYLKKEDARNYSTITYNLLVRIKKGKKKPNTMISQVVIKLIHLLVKSAEMIRKSIICDFLSIA